MKVSNVHPFDMTKAPDRKAIQKGSFFLKFSQISSELKRDWSQLKLNIKTDAVKTLAPNEKKFQEATDALIQLSNGDDSLIKVCMTLSELIQTKLIENEALADLKGVVQKDPEVLKVIIAEKMMKLITQIVRPKGEFRERSYSSSNEVVERLFIEILHLIQEPLQKIKEIEKLEEGIEKNKKLKQIFREIIEGVALRIFPNKEKDNSLPLIARSCLRVLGFVRSKYSWEGMIDQAAGKLFELHQVLKELEKGADELNKRIEGGSEIIEKSVEHQILALKAKGIKIESVLDQKTLAKLSPEIRAAINHLLEIITKNPKESTEVEQLLGFIKHLLTLVASSYGSQLLKPDYPKQPVKEKIYDLIGICFAKVQRFYEGIQLGGDRTKLSEQLSEDLLEDFFPKTWFDRLVPSFLQKTKLYQKISQLIKTEGAKFIPASVDVFDEIRQGPSRLETLIPGSKKVIDLIVENFLVGSTQKEIEMFGLEIVSLFDSKKNEKINHEIKTILMESKTDLELTEAQERVKIFLKFVVSASIVKLCSRNPAETTKQNLASLLGKEIELSKDFLVQFENCKEEEEKEKLFHSLANQLLEEVFPKNSLPQKIHYAAITLLSDALKELFITKQRLQQESDHAKSSLSQEANKLVANLEEKAKQSMQNTALLKGLLSKHTEVFHSLVQMLLPLGIDRLLKTIPALENDPAFLAKGLIQIISSINKHLKGEREKLDGLTEEEFKDGKKFYAKLKDRIVHLFFKNKDEIPVSANLQATVWRKIHVNLMEGLETFSKFESKSFRLKTIIHILIDKIYELDKKNAKLIGLSASKRIHLPQGIPTEKMAILTKHLLILYFKKQIDLASNRLLMRWIKNENMDFVKLPFILLFCNIVYIAELCLDFVIKRISNSVIDLVMRDDFDLLLRKILWDLMDLINGKDEFSQQATTYKDQLGESIAEFLKVTKMVPEKIITPTAFLIKNALGFSVKHTAIEIAGDLLEKEKQQSYAPANKNTHRL